VSNAPWLAHYPSDVPKELPPVAFSNLPELLRFASDQYKKTTAAEINPLRGQVAATINYTPQTGA
jgi:hypothetical protein